MATVSLDTNSRMLLQSLLKKSCNIAKDSADMEAVLLNIEKILTSSIRKPGREVYTAGESGTIAPGFKSYTITNLGSTNATLGNKALYPGQSNSFSAGGVNDTLDAIDYDAQSTILEIITVL